MRKLIKEIIAPVIPALVDLRPDMSILEIGSFCVPAQKQFANLRPLFSGCRYLGIDRVTGLGVDRVADAHHLPFADGSFDVVLLFDVIEHVAAPDTVIGQAVRVLRQPGWVFVSSHQNFPVHYPPDYWRFTPQGFAYLLRRFAGQYVYAQDNEYISRDNSSFVFGIGTTHLWSPGEDFEQMLFAEHVHRIQTPDIPDADFLRPQR